MEESNSCFVFLWERGVIVDGEKVENEGRNVPTSNWSTEERGATTEVGVLNLALVYLDMVR